MDSEVYWAQRAEEREQYWHKKCQETIERELASYYRASLGRIQTEIAALYGRFAVDNELTMAEARKLLKGNEFRQWRMDIQEYVKKIEATGDKGLERELNVLAMRSRISRLDKLYSETLVELDKLGRKVSKSMKSFLTDAYKDNYYHGLYDIAKAGELQNAVSKVDSKALEDVLRTRWSGKNYSERIWKNQKLLAQTIKDEMMTAVHRGESVEKISKRVAKRMDVGISNARRLVRTELNFVNNQAAFESIEDAGMKYYRFIATLDRRTSDKCRSMDGKVFYLQEREYGVNIPPLHPNCRSTIAGSLYGPNKAKTGTRAARDEGGKTVYVPADMTYEDWKSVYVDKSKTLEEWLKEHNNPLLKLQQLIDKVELKTCSKDDVISIGKAICEHFNLEEKIGDKNALKSIFSYFREMDGNIQAKDFAKGSALANKKMLTEAFSYYPKAWSDYLRESGRQIYTKKVQRGFFCSGAVKPSGKYYESNFDDFRDKYVSIHMSGERRTTPYHEIGHMVEFFNPNALRISKEFIKARTQGEKAVPLRDLFPSSGYGIQEVTKPDDFISPYIGKEYPAATEVLSMGLEQIFEPTNMLKRVEWVDGHYEREYATIKEDEEYLYLIVGLILKA